MNPDVRPTSFEGEYYGWKIKIRSMPSGAPPYVQVWPPGRHPTEGGAVVVDFFTRSTWPDSWIEALQKATDWIDHERAREGDSGQRRRQPLLRRNVHRGGHKAEGPVPHQLVRGRDTLWGDQAEKIETTVTGDASGNTIRGKLTRMGYS
jgi:hypothetical protein